MQHNGLWLVGPQQGTSGNWQELEMEKDLWFVYKDAEGGNKKVCVKPSLTT